MHQHLQVANLEGSVFHWRSTVWTGCKRQAVQVLVKASTAFLNVEEQK